MESGRAKYTYLKMQGARDGLLWHIRVWQLPVRMSMKIASPAFTSRTKLKPSVSMATLSEDRA
eukprot:5768747-Ditylum_brightwellii.AAC.1